MATITRFEDLEIWQMARSVCQIINLITKRHPFNKDFTLVDQIKRSSGSVMDNIAEGFERGGNKEFIHFLFISKGSAGETRSQLLRALDNEYINQDDFGQFNKDLNFLSTKIYNMISYLKNSDVKGIKFKNRKP